MAVRPITPRLRCSVDSHMRSVNPESASGSPEEKPSTVMISSSFGDSFGAGSMCAYCGRDAPRRVKTCLSVRLDGEQIHEDEQRHV